MKTQFVLGALEQAIRQRKTPDNKDLVQHSDRRPYGLTVFAYSRDVTEGIASGSFAGMFHA